MATFIANAPGSGVGVSGPASAYAQPREDPRATSGTQPPNVKDAWSAYSGHWHDAPLTQLENQPDLNVMPNRIRPIVNGGVDFLFGPVLTISTANEKAQAIIDAVWGDTDERMTKLSKLGINGGAFGHVFAKVVVPRRGVPSAKNPPRIVVLNPENVSVDTDPDDCELVTRYYIEYDAVDVNGTPIKKRQTITRFDPDGDDDTVAAGQDTDTQWAIQNWQRSAAGTTWTAIDEPVVWPYECAPIIDWQNFPNPNAHWGQPDITPGIIHINEKLQLVESNTNATLYSHGHPWMFATGCDPSDIKAVPGAVTGLPDTDSKVFAVQASGAIPDMMAYADGLRADMDEESGMPSTALGRMKDLPRGQVSGVTIRLLYASPLARTEHKRRLYGQGIRCICELALRLCGFSVEEVAKISIDLQWEDPLPADDLAQAQTLLAWQQLGVPQETIFEKLGLNPDLQFERMQDQAAREAENFSKGQGMPTVPAMPQGDVVSQQQHPELTPAQVTGLNHPAAQQARANARRMAQPATSMSSKPGGNA